MANPPRLHRRRRSTLFPYTTLFRSHTDPWFRILRTTEAKAFVGSEAHPTSQNYTSTGLRSQRLVDVLCVHVADQPDTIAWQLACSSCSNSPVIYSGRLRRQHATQACVLGRHLSRDVRGRATTRCARAACGASRTRGSAGTIARQDLVGPYGRQQALRSWQTEAARRGQCSRVADEVTAPESHGAELLRQPRASGVSL